jgi:GNAT superfamily N-acetyltransferase
LDVTAMLELYDRYERLEAQYPRCRREAVGNIVRTLSLDPAGPSWIIHSRLTEEDADWAIETELAYFRGLGRGFEWKLYSHDRPADLKARLAAKGFSIGEDEAIMAISLAELPAILLAEHSHDVRKVEDEAGLADYASLNAQTWTDDDGAWIESVIRTLREMPERLSAYVAYADGIPVCAARIDFPERSPFASLWGGATLEPYRKRGIYTAVLAARAEEAIVRGYRFLTIDASPMSRPIVTRCGFSLLAISNPCDSPKG